MPAKSKSQQRFFGMVHAVQKGTMKAPSKEIANTAANISYQDSGDFAKTKHKGLPEKTSGLASALLSDKGPSVRDRVGGSVGMAAGGLGALAGLQHLPGMAMRGAASTLAEHDIARMANQQALGNMVGGNLDSAIHGAYQNRANMWSRGAGPKVVGQTTSALKHLPELLGVRSPLISKLLRLLGTRKGAIGTLAGLTGLGVLGGGAVGDKLQGAMGMKSSSVKTAAEQLTHDKLALMLVKKSSSLCLRPTCQRMADFLDCQAILHEELRPLAKLARCLRGSRSLYDAVMQTFPNAEKTECVKLAAKTAKSYLDARQVAVNTLRLAK